MKIVFTTFFKESKGGGCGRVSHEIAQAFAKEGHETVLVCPGSRTEVKKIAPHLRYLQIKSFGNGDVAIPYLTVKNLQFLFNFLKTFSPQVIHAHDFGPITLCSQFWAINNQIPFVYTSHVLPTKTFDFAIGESSKALSRFLDTSLMRRYFLNFFKNADALIALNKDVKKDILKYGFKNKIFTISNGRDLRIYRVCPLAQLKEKEKQMTFIGYLSLRKNQRYLLRVLKYLPSNFTLNLVGSPINPAYLKVLKDDVSKNRLKNVNFLGEIPYEQIPQILAKTHLFVSASKMEVQSLVIIEALASATPVVALENETTKELVDDSVGFCLGKKTPPVVFAQHIKEIYALSSREYEILCQNARRKVAHLDWPQIVKQTELVYQNLLAEKKKANGSKQIKRMVAFKEFISLFPSSKMRTFLLKQWEKPQNLSKKNIFSLVLTVVGTFLIGSLYYLLKKIKIVHY
ncbi:MAG: glycosyltransferase family 4 protein [Candidatus Shapirobacteria bacterium]|nr:glycosyltransferase family 4 protein [Candidatus Shapirobacteria bacterium]